MGTYASTDAYFRSDDWPTAVPAHRMLGYLLRFRKGRSVGAGL
ncbi:MAG: hypothetical protein QOH91_775 [Mycobacterium sp.]|jgi:hypothetical protein|nr:hypothetical protein [Mycobacterium sp.]